MTIALRLWRRARLLWCPFVVTSFRRTSTGSSWLNLGSAERKRSLTLYISLFVRQLQDAGSFLSIRWILLYSKLALFHALRSFLQLGFFSLTFFFTFPVITVNAMRIPKPKFWEHVSNLNTFVSRNLTLTKQNLEYDIFSVRKGNLLHWSVLAWSKITTNLQLQLNEG